MGNLFAKSVKKLTIEERRKRALLIHSNINKLIKIAENENLINKLKKSIAEQNENITKVNLLIMQVLNQNVNMIPTDDLNNITPIYNPETGRNIYKLYKSFYSFDKLNIDLIHTGSKNHIKLY